MAKYEPVEMVPVYSRYGADLPDGVVPAGSVPIGDGELQALSGAVNESQVGVPAQSWDDQTDA